MASIQELKNRINSIKSIKKITKAFNLIATSKFQNTKKIFLVNKPYIDQMLEPFALITKNFDYSIFSKYKTNKNLFLIISSDYGMCGVYNKNIFKIALEKIKDNDYVCVLGKKGFNFFSKRQNFKIINNLTLIGENYKFNYLKKITNLIINYFDKVDNFFIITTSYINNLVFEVKTMNFLELLKTKNKQLINQAYTFEESPTTLFDKNKFFLINCLIHYAILESKLAEYGYRRNATDSATQNAIELIDKLTLKFNQIRQANITQEIAEIIGSL